MKFLRQDGWFQPVAPSDIITSTATTTGFLTYITKSTTANITINSSSVYTDGPSVAQGSSGTWFATGTVTIETSAAVNPYVYLRLWDGTTTIASATTDFGSAVAGNNTVVSLSGVLASPAGNLRISAISANTLSFQVGTNSANSADCTITAIRIG